METKRLSKTIFRDLPKGTPEYVHNHGLWRKSRDENPDARLSKKFGGFGNGFAFRLANLLVQDTETTLMTQPYLRAEIDWAKEYQKHLSGPDAAIPFGPTSGIDRCECKYCYFRDAPIEQNPTKDCQVGENGDDAKKFFGLPSKMYLPERIGEKEVGHYCPFWLSFLAE